MKIYRLFKILWDLFVIKKIEITEICPLTIPRYCVSSLVLNGLHLNISLKFFRFLILNILLFLNLKSI